MQIVLASFDLACPDVKNAINPRGTLKVECKNDRAQKSRPRLFRRA